MARHAEGAGHHDELVDLARRGPRTTRPSVRATRPSGWPSWASSPTATWTRSAAARRLARRVADDAIEHARRLEADADRAGDLERRAEACRLLIRLYWEHGLDEERKATTAALEADLDELGDTPAQALAFGLLAQEAMLDNRIDETVERAERAIQAAERHDMPDVALPPSSRRAAP